MIASTRERRSQRWTVGEACAQDKDEIIRLFEKVFGQTMDDDLWNWKYGDGRGMAFIAKRNQTVIAHYGGIKRDVIINNERQASVQCVDTMVDPKERGTLARKGPYFLTARAFLDRFVGYNRPFEFGFGFPNKRVMRLGERVGIQTSIGEIVEPVWLPLSESQSYAMEIDWQSTNHQQLVEHLFTDMTRSLNQSIVGVRDLSYLHYRYMENPLFDYNTQLIRAKDDRTLLGLVVYRKEGENLLLMDVIGHPQNFPSLIDQVRSACAANQANTLTAWISGAHLDLFGSAWAHINDPEVRIPTSICTDGPSPESLKNRWWLMAGDTDFK